MKNILSIILFATTSLVFADDSAVYLNANTGISTVSNLPSGSWVGSINAGYNFNLLG